jgi:putative transposase
LRQVATIVTSDTILRWHRQLIARKWMFHAEAAGPSRDHAGDLVAHCADGHGESGWGYTRLQGALKNLGHSVARSTVAKVVKANGIPPASDRPTSWRTFLRAHWGAIAGAEFFTSEVWTPRGLITYYPLFVIDLRSRRVHVAGSTPTPDAWFMA